jgi:peptide-methionine (S)-S-oxide reductase
MEKKQIATLAGGCFWCMEAVFKQMHGIERTVPGYIDGKLPNPTYEAVCTGNTGYAEAVQITFNTEQVTYRELLTVFFSIHDPTSLNMQGDDIGTQYRSAIYYHNQEQHFEAIDIITMLKKQNVFPSPIQTKIVLASTFYPAEDYHQNYFTNNPTQSYCELVISPKLKKFKDTFSAKLK